MTKKNLILVLMFGTFLVLSSAALAGDAPEAVTLTGSIACAKCTLHVADAKECQSVLVVDKGGEGAEPTYYYLVSNQVAKDFGHVCMGKKAAVVTGTVEEKEGKLWLTASKMEAPKEG